ncbi:MAG TPA: helix-turn-helix transcriptional regulator [Gaiellaceae bacterium]|nr:helix-turn-helix transcriptional regulator [Gaiellaceae bacterium]
MISGDLLREARLRAGLTQRQLAIRAKTSQSAIARWESGEVQPSLERLLELIRACGLELWFRMSNYDDSYLPDIADNLRATPAERIDRAVALVNALRPLEAARAEADAV